MNSKLCEKGDEKMPSNFRILTHRNESTMHLKLMGDFDESSAYQLLTCLRDYRNGISTIFIHTNSLKRIIASGRNVFCDNLAPLKGNHVRLVFTGENASKLSP
jgi:hypothetical protein